MDNRDKAFIGVAMIAIGITCNALGQSSSYTIGTVAGPGDNGDGGPAIAAQFVSPRGVAFDGAGNMYIADFTRVRKVSVDGTVSPFAGTWQAGFSGDGGPATEAILNGPVALAIDRSGAVYIADAGNNRVRKVTTDGIIQTVAGPGVSGVIGDGGPAT